MNKKNKKDKENKMLLYTKTYKEGIEVVNQQHNKYYQQTH